MTLPSSRERESGRTPSLFRGGGLLDDLFQDLEDTFFRGFTGSSKLGNVDIYEKDGKLHYELELPGLSKDEIDVQAKEGHLVVIGEVEQSREDEDVNYLSRGRRYGRFRRILPLPEGIEDPGKLSAKFESGVLKITAQLEEALDEEEVVEVEIE